MNTPRFNQGYESFPNFRVKSNPPFGRNEQIVIHDQSSKNPCDYESPSSNNAETPRSEARNLSTEKSINMSISKPNESRMDLMTKGKSMRKNDDNNDPDVKTIEKTRSKQLKKGDTAIF